MQCRKRFSREKQQGFVLALSLLVIFFVTLVVVSSIDRTGTEQRVASSELHTASAQAAAEVGLFRLRQQLTLENNACTTPDPYTCAEQMLTHFENESTLRNLLDMPDALSYGAGVRDDRRVYDSENQLFWWIPSQCPVITTNEQEPLSFNVISYGEAGLDSGNLRQRVVVSARIQFTTNNGTPDLDDPSDSPENGSNQQALQELFGRFATISQTANLQGSGKIFGNVAAVSEPSLTGNPTFAGEYSEISTDAYDQQKSVVNNYFSGLSALGYNSGTQTQVPSLGGYPFKNSELSPAGWRGFNLTHDINDWQSFNLTVHNNQSFMGQNVSVIPLSELKIESDADIAVKGGNVVLYVDGDVDLLGNARFIIDSNSSLTLMMTGQFTLGGSFSFAYRDVSSGIIYTGNQMENRVLNERNYPIFSVYTSYQQTRRNDHGARVQGNTNLYGVIYAANSDVRITGSGDVWGSVFSNNVEVTGNASINFATDDIDGGDTDGEDTDNEPQEPRVVTELNSRFDYDISEPLPACP